MAGHDHNTQNQRQVLRNIRRTATLALLCLVIAGCHHSDTRLDEAPKSTSRCRGFIPVRSNSIQKTAFKRTESSPSASRMTEVPTASVPVVVIGRFVDRPLSNAQIREILEAAEPKTPAGTRVWFIGVHANQSRGDGRRFSCNVYFTPESQSDRVRHGHGVHVGPRMVFVFDPDTSIPQARHSDQLAAGDLRPYVQVSKLDAPFEDSLEIPTGTMQPINRPNELTDVDLVEVIDFIRTGPRLPDEPGAMHASSKVASNAPIVEIRKTDNGYEVRTGFQEDRLSGFGTIVECEKTDKGLKLTTLGTWVS